MGKNAVMTVQEVAAMMRVSDKTVVDAYKRGELRGAKIGSRYRFVRVDVVNYVNNRIHGISALSREPATVPTIATPLSSGLCRVRAGCSHLSRGSKWGICNAHYTRALARRRFCGGDMSKAVDQQISNGKPITDPNPLKCGVIECSWGQVANGLCSIHNDMAYKAVKRTEGRMDISTAVRTLIAAPTTTAPFAPTSEPSIRDLESKITTLVSDQAALALKIDALVRLWAPKEEASI